MCTFVDPHSADLRLALQGLAGSRSQHGIDPRLGRVESVGSMGRKQVSLYSPFPCVCYC